MAAAAPRGKKKMLARTATSPTQKSAPTAPRQSRLLSGETSAKKPKYQALRGAVNTRAPAVAERLAAV